MKRKLRYAAITVFALLVAIAETKRKPAVELDVDLFDDDYVSRMEDQIRGWAPFQRQRVLSLLGKLALYARLHRVWMHDPRTGRRGATRHFPRPAVAFHPWVFDDCSTTFSICVEKIYTNVQNRSSILFPVRGQPAKDFIFDEAIFTRSVTNTMFVFDTSVFYLFCFLSMSQLPALRRLPFCDYGVDRHQMRRWPTARFQDAHSRLNIRHGAAAGVEPIDHFDSGQADFQCATESFCPDPCCGRLTRRSATSTNYCQRSVCLHNDEEVEDQQAKLMTVATTGNAVPALSSSIDDRTSTKASTPNDLITSSQSNSYHYHRRRSAVDDHRSQVSLADAAAHACHVDDALNDDLRAIMDNRWNVSCACVTPSTSSTSQAPIIDPTRFYRFDVKMCVDVDECIYATCPADEECVNTLGGYVCVCRLGYCRESGGANSTCRPIRFSSAAMNSMSPMLAKVLEPP